MAENKSLDPMTVEASLTTIYPKKFKAMCIGREKRKIGDALGLNKFGVNLVTLKPGAASSQRHWHCLLYTSPSPRDRTRSRMPSSA